MNQSVNDEAVCRTAPATPGLLKIFYMENATAKVTKQVSVFCSEESKPSPCSNCQALQNKCTECRHQGEKENDVINQIKNKHQPI